MTFIAITKKFNKNILNVINKESKDIFKLNDEINELLKKFS